MCKVQTKKDTFNRINGKKTNASSLIQIKVKTRQNKRK